jgi:hypothetical protein
VESLLKPESENWADPFLQKYLRRFMEKTQGKIRWKVITLTRDPLATVVSNFFQSTTRHELDSLEGDALFEKVATLLKEHILWTNDPNNILAGMNWFDSQLKEVFGFDIFSKAFDRSVGYGIYRAENADILIIRLEDLSRCAPEAFDKFLGLKNFNLRIANESAGKLDKKVYQRVKASVGFPEEVVESFYNTRYVHYFYSESEIQAFKQRWTARTVAEDHQLLTKPA